MNVSFWAVAIGQELFVRKDVAARHRIRARPRREQDGHEKSVLFGILPYGGALKAVDGRGVDVVQDDLLGVALGQSIMWLEKENCR